MGDAFRSLPKLRQSGNHRRGDDGLDDVAEHEAHGSDGHDRQGYARDGGLNDESEEIVHGDAAHQGRAAIPCRGQHAAFGRVGARFALEQRGDDGGGQESEQESGARSDQRQSGGATGEYRRPDTGRWLRRPAAKAA